MKRIVMLMLTLSMIVNLGITAQAGEQTFESTGSTDFEVYGVYAEGGTPTVYSVDVTWGSMVLYYNANECKGVWQPDTLSYDTTSALEKGWYVLNEDDNKIIIKNRSNACVDIVLDYAHDDVTSVYDNITATFASDAEGNTAYETSEYPEGEAGFTVYHKNYNGEVLTEEDITKTAYLLLDGEISEDVNGDRIGNIVVTIMAAADTK